MSGAEDANAPRSGAFTAVPLSQHAAAVVAAAKARRDKLDGAGCELEPPSTSGGLTEAIGTRDKVDGAGCELEPPSTSGGLTEAIGTRDKVDGAACELEPPSTSGGLTEAIGTRENVRVTRQASAKEQQHTKRRLPLLHPHHVDATERRSRYAAYRLSAIDRLAKVEWSLPGSVHIVASMILRHYCQPDMRHSREFFINNGNFATWVKIETIAKKISCSPKTVRRALKAALGLGLITEKPLAGPKPFTGPPMVFLSSDWLWGGSERRAEMRTIRARDVDTNGPEMRTLLAAKDVDKNVHNSHAKLQPYQSTTPSSATETNVRESPGEAESIINKTSEDDAKIARQDGKPSKAATAYVKWLPGNTRQGSTHEENIAAYIDQLIDRGNRENSHSARRMRQARFPDSRCARSN